MAAGLPITDHGFCAACRCAWFNGHDCGTGSYQINNRYSSTVGYRRTSKPVESAPEPQESKAPIRLSGHQSQPRRGNVGRVRPLNLSRGLLPKARGNC